MAKGRVCSHRVILGANTADHATDQPSTGNTINHGVFLCQGQRMFADTEGVAEHGYLGCCRSPSKSCCGHNRRWHNTIGILMMLIYAKPIETEFLTHLQFVKVSVIKILPNLWIKVGIGIDHPGGFVFLIVVQIQTGVGHQMKEKTPHSCSPNLESNNLIIAL